MGYGVVAVLRGCGFRTGAREWLLSLTLVFLCSSFFPAAVANAATVVPDVNTFDHLATGFPLSGEHAIIDCEACHLGGVFEVLPTQCAACHDGVLAVGPSLTHIPTTASCDLCHTPVGFVESAVMDHSTIGTTTCATCHNGVIAIGGGGGGGGGGG